MGKPLGVIRLANLNRSGTWASGRPRYYYRPKGGKNVPLPDYPLTDRRFLEAYMKAAGLSETPKVKGHTSQMVNGYLKSEAFTGLAKGTKAYLWKHLDEIEAEFGAYPLGGLTAKAIRKDLSRFGESAKAKRLKAWRGLCRFAHDAGEIDANPALQVAKPAQKLVGHEAWTADDVRTFRRHWRLDTPQRLLFEALLWTGARMSDAVRLHDGMIGKDGWARFQQVKTKNRVRGKGWVAVPIHAKAKPWAGSQTALLAALKARPVKHLAWIVTAYGAPRSVKAASQWFAAAARQAGVQKSAHGIRKYRAATMKEAGAGADARMAWLGHVTESEAEDYALTADLKRIISA